MKDMEKLMFGGSKFSYRVPDWHRHENVIANFMLVANSSGLSVIYCGNEGICTCKDGWTKFENVTKEPNMTRQSLVDHLAGYYGGDFDASTITFQEDEK